jgi:hypothetical protein
MVKSPRLRDEDGLMRSIILSGKEKRPVHGINPDTV